MKKYEKIKSFCVFANKASTVSSSLTHTIFHDLLSLLRIDSRSWYTNSTIDVGRSEYGWNPVSLATFEQDIFTILVDKSLELRNSFIYYLVREVDSFELFSKVARRTRFSTSRRIQLIEKFASKSRTRCSFDCFDLRGEKSERIRSKDTLLLFTSIRYLLSAYTVP